MAAPALLLVEDSAEEAAPIASALRRALPGNRIAVFRSGLSALDYLHVRGDFARRPVHELPALILLDLELPGMSGLDLLHALRQSPRTRLLPVIVLAASARQADVSRARRLGANSFVRKPLDAARLAQSLELLAGYWLGLNIAPPVPGHSEALR